MFRGPQCRPEFVSSLIRDVTKIYENEILNSQVKKPIMSEEAWKEYRTATECFICKDGFPDISHLTKEDQKKEKRRKVLEHCHLTGKFRGKNFILLVFFT